MKKEFTYCEDYNQKIALFSDVFLGVFFITDDFMPKKNHEEKSLGKTHIDPQFKWIQTGFNTSYIDCCSKFAFDDIII